MFDNIEDWLRNPKLAADHWVTEQTLHAPYSTIYGVEFLPDTYCVSSGPGLTPSTVSKHYAGKDKRFLYAEGMRRLMNDGLIQKLKASAPRTTP